MKAMNVRVVEGDLPSDDLRQAIAVGKVGCDIETSGLDWRVERIGTFQIAIDDDVVVVHRPNDLPSNLLNLLKSSEVTKVFHHAAFDLRFVTAHWGAKPASVRCTKIAAKIAQPGLDSDYYSLKSLVGIKLGIEIDKTERLSNWVGELDDSQLSYAANDVSHLVDLDETIRSELLGSPREELLRRSLEYLPSRVALDLLGAGDVFAY